MLFEAPHNGVCRACTLPIAKGSRICWEKGWEYTEHEECSDEGRARIKGIEASYAYESDRKFPVPEGLDYLPFQKAGIAYALDRPEGIGCILGDEMGLGKSIEAIGVINGDDSIHTVLVVCPATLKLNWRNECKKWIVRACEVQLKTDPLWQISLETDPTAIRIQVINYEEFEKTVKPSSRYDLMVLDEAHMIKNPESIRGKFARRMGRRCKRTLCLTGTPIPNHVIDIFPLLQICDPKTWDSPGMVKGFPVDLGCGAGLFPFAKRYCNARKLTFGKGQAAKTIWDMKGSSNLDELHDRLRTTIMVRRLKRDVLRELPDKIRSLLTLPIEYGLIKELIATEKSLWERGGFQPEDILGLEKQRGLLFDEFSSARKELGIAKCPYVVQHVRGVLEAGIEEGTKVILFAHHDDVMTNLISKLGEYQPAIIRGYTDIELRQASVDRFQNDTECRVFIGSIGAAGVGITLTASSHVIFAEESWVPKDITQAEDRAHRIGQKNSVLVEHLVFDGSLDANMMVKVLKKQEAADNALDRK